MALNEQDTSAGAQAHYAAAAVEIGQRLAERRTSRGQTLEEHMVPLRTTRHQLAALESGNTQVFYGRSYYEGLLARYAAALGLKAEDLLVSLRPAPSAEEAPLPEPPIDQPPASQPEPLADPPHLRRQRSALAVACAVTVLAIASAMLVWWDSEPSPAPTATTPGLTPEATPETTPEATLEATPEITAAITPTAGPAATPELTPLATTPTAPAPTPVPAPAPAPEAPALRLRAGNAATWYWVRKANDEVEQRSLSGGGSVAFDEMPIYLVVNGPDEVRVEVRGKEVRLKANDETGRNLARVGRIALEDLAR